MDVDDWKLIIEDDAGETISVPIDREEISIGRNDGNAIRLTERNVSRHHAKLSRQNGHVFIEDLSSYNGVKINGDKIKGTIELREGDLIEIGDYHLAIQNQNVGASSDAHTDAQGLPASARLDNVNLDEDTAQWEPPGSLTGRRPDSTETAQMEQPPSKATIPSGAARPAMTFKDPMAAPILASDDEDTELVPRFPSEEETFPRFVAVTTYLAGKVYPFDGDVMDIGRTDANSLTIDHKSVSRAHAKILRDGKHFRIKDRGSSNGILVNGKEVRTALLRSGDEVELGRVRLRFVPAGEEFKLSADEIARARIGDDDEDGWGDDKPTTMRTQYSPEELAALRRGPSMQLLMIAAVVLILTIVGGLLYINGGEEKRSPKPNPVVEPKPKPNPTASQGEAAAAKSAADTLRREGKWVAAAEAYDKAVDLGAKVDAEVLQKVNDESSAATQLESARKSFNEGEYKKTVELCTVVIELGETHASKPAIELKEKASGALVDQYKTQAEEAIRARNQEGAKTAIAELRALGQDEMATALERKRASSIRTAKPKPRPKPKPKPRPKKPVISDTPIELPTARDDRAESRALIGRANGLLSQGQPGQALKLVREAESLDPSPSALYRVKGLALELTGQTKQAVAAYKKYLRRNPAAADKSRIKRVIDKLETNDK